MIKYQLTVEGYKPIFVQHLGESGDDKLIPIFETTTGSEIIFNLFILPTMKRVRLVGMHSWGGRNLLQIELDIIMRSPQLAPWQPLLIEGVVLYPTNTPVENPDQQD